MPRRRRLQPISPDERLDGCRGDAGRCGNQPGPGSGARVTDAPVAWRDGVVRLGDSEAQVLKRAGKRPERAVTLYLADHVAVGEQWRFSGAPGSRQLLWVARMRGRVVRMWIETSGGAALP